ncbi:FAD-binding oxidoreductase [Methylobacterium oryzihabitans]|uniref:FAD-binding oxidoreductase n=1 Tax=Methylobacterium oryzihabitans TaxID=2499852 RepID=A0A3S2WFP9_9HYPH|nr:FAD-binding oxidoreductase [Methylobacterium oryzihabitans]RVU21217.1 FAD-binding oxidoreductase [Methylobacterium oryzihabitans]
MTTAEPTASIAQGATTRDLTADPARFAREILDPIRAVVGERGVITDRAAMQPMMVAWRDNWNGRVPLVVMPATTEQMAAVVAICARTNTPIVPQGGNTGLTGAGQPHGDDSEIVVSTRRMNRIREIDLANDTITVDAGVVLQVIQETARANGRLFPLSLGAEGSCQIGGNLSTNAGGVQALRYGTARALVAGLEVVLPDGQIWDGLRGLRKDNAGYDLKQIFIGAEGTLGIITAATLKLLPLPKASATAFLATPSPATAVSWLRRAKSSLGDSITTVELMERRCLDVAIKHNASIRDPLPTRHDWYLLVEVADQSTHDALEAHLLSALEAGLDGGELVDGTVASSAEQAAALWRIREGTPEGQRLEGASYKHDVSVPISKVAQFIEEANGALETRFPGLRSFAFGHLGDGNIHYNPLQAEGGDGSVWQSYLPEVNQIVHDIVAKLGGSITAEHGIGRLRIGEVERYKSDVEMMMMRKLKNCFDPYNIMNPGKLLTRARLSPGTAG